MNTNHFMNNILMISTMNNIAHEYIRHYYHFRWIDTISDGLKKIPIVKKICDERHFGYKQMSAMEKMFDYEKMSTMEECWL